MKNSSRRSNKAINRKEFLQTIVGTAVVGKALPDHLFAQGAESQGQEAGARKNPNRMVVDRLERAERYFSRHPLFEKAFTFLRQPSLAELATGKHEVDGTRIYCLISKGPGRKRTEAKLEAHRKYIDIQYVIHGPDEMGWKPTAACQSLDQDYDADKDIMFFKDQPQKWTKVPTGSFAIFFPRDSHAPLVSSGEIHKVVMKVAVE
jgi:biofilm protein TabA